MEAGSLLQEALQHGKAGSQLDDESLTKNVLYLDIFPLSPSQDSTERLLQLAHLATQCNEYFAAQSFQWHSGGDGPVFGVHVNENHKVPHLRAYCRYGLGVADEWVAIERMLCMSRDTSEDWAATCWDAQDGQVIFIQAADVLPDLLDQDPTDNHRYACWIRGGKVQVFTEPHIGLDTAINRLESMDAATPSSHPQIQQVLEDYIHWNREHAYTKQRMPVVVPRSIAALIEHRPDLIHSAVSAFCDNIHSPPPDLKSLEDWVWTTATVSRTQYAALRTIVSSEWPTSDHLPPVGVEVKRYKRQCAMEATPRVRHAVALGVRLAAGLQYLGQQTWNLPATEERMLFWTRVDQQCQTTTAPSTPWILESYQQGPNHANHNLEHMIRCPVFPEEAKNMTLRTFPTTALSQQIRMAQKRQDVDKEYPMPREEEVDDESWLDLSTDPNAEGGNALDKMLSRFQTFMHEPSGFEGVGSDPVESTVPLNGNVNDNEATSCEQEIRPRVVLNLLHAILTGGELPSFNSKLHDKRHEQEQQDPYFFEEDYNLMTGDSEQVKEITNLMDAMDQELEGRSTTRDLDSFAEDDNDFAMDDNPELAENTHVLGNLLQSLEASGGESGPVRTILSDMQRDSG